MYQNNLILFLESKILIYKRVSKIEYGQAEKLKSLKVAKSKDEILVKDVGEDC